MNHFTERKVNIFLNIAHKVFKSVLFQWNFLQHVSNFVLNFLKLLQNFWFEKENTGIKLLLIWLAWLITEKKEKKNNASVHMKYFSKLCV